MSRHRTIRLELLERRELLSVGPIPVLRPGSLVAPAKAATPPAVAKLVGDDFGNTFAQARLIGLYSNGSGQVAGSIEKAGDVDFFRMVAPVTGRMTVRQTAASGSPLDSFVYVYDSKQTLLVASNDDGALPKTLNSRVDFNVKAGETFYVRAGAFRLTSGKYFVQFSTVPGVVDDFANSFDAAATLPLKADGSATLAGKIEYAGDVDTFRVMTTAPGHLVFRQVVAPGSAVDPLLSLYDSNRHLIVQSNNYGLSKDSQVEIETTAGGVFYLQAAAMGTTVGAYTIQVNTLPIPAADDYGNTILDATPIYVGSDGYSIQSGQIEKAGDVDMFAIVAPMDGHMVFQETAAPGSWLVPNLSIYDPALTLLGTSDGTGKAYSSVDVAVTGGQTYYVQAGGSGTSAGKYTLQTTMYVPPPLPDGTFNITLNMNIPDPSQAAVVQQAAHRWEEVITCDLPPVRYKGTWIDDLRIDFSIEDIDGPGGILGYSVTPVCRPVTPGKLGSGLPFYNQITFDAADVSDMMANGYFFAVAEHEMGHAVGIGGLWQKFGLVSGSGTFDPRYTGKNAVAEYDSIFSTTITTVPLEAWGGPGTAEAHWRKDTFGSELMTGYVYPLDTVNTGHPLSRITVASLADLGYTIDLTKADAYIAPGPAAIRGSGGGAPSGAPSGMVLSRATPPVAAVDRGVDAAAGNLIFGSMAARYERGGAATLSSTSGSVVDHWRWWLSGDPADDVVQSRAKRGGKALPCCR